ncbi:MAG TPA: cytochrome P450 [Acidimicrobiales bacterium]|nr:cytochrome P450 [Acidimicrobiales bacterium]
MAHGSIDFDPFSDTFFDDPYAAYARLRDEAPVYRNETYGFYALSRHADVVAAHGDPVRFVSSYGVTLELLLKKRPMDTNMMIVMDPPEHTRLRKLVSQAFSRNAIGSLEPLVAEVVAGYLDALSGRNEFDLVAEFAALFPVEVISTILGVPEGERQQVRLWVDTFLHREEGNPNTTQEGMEASLNMAGYFLDLARLKRREHDGLLISKLTEAVLRDDEGREHHLSDEDVAAFSVLIAGAGSETVTKLIGSGVVLFDQHPEQWELVQADKAAIPHAVEEVLRMHPPSQYQGRFATDEVEFDGGTIPANSPVILLTGAATRDPRAYERPDTFDIGRGGRTTLAFGYGVHGCLGAWLARLESNLAFEGIRARWPHFAVQHDGLRRVNMANVAGYSNVPVVVP